MKLRRLALLPLASLPLLACSGGSSEPAPPNVVLILLDTLRADRLSAYGYERPTTPFLERFSRQAVRFSDVHAQAGCTFPSVNSILTSRYTEPFLASAGDTWGIPETLPSLPTILRDHGYATAAVSASPVVRATPSNINRKGGFGTGFETFDESCLDRNAACVNARALDRLTDLEAPFFLYLHYMDPHGPYRPPAGHERQFAKDPPAGSPRFVRRGNLNPIARAIREGQPALSLSEAEVAHLRDLYDEEVLYLDHELGELFHALEQRELLDTTILVVMSDHGEEILEHGDVSHCRDLIFETVMKVPLWIRYPDRRAGVVEEPVENLDLLPTLLAALGIDSAEYTLQGESLMPLLRPEIARDDSPLRYAFLRQGRYRAVTDGRAKLTYDVTSGAFRLFDLVTDPLETTDVAAQRPDDLRRLRRELLTWLRAEEGGDLGKDSADDAQRLEEELRALGYLG